MDWRPTDEERQQGLGVTLVLIATVVALAFPVHILAILVGIVVSRIVYKIGESFV
jgi:hypothetical protein